MLDTLLFVAFPYAAFALAVGGGLYRYFYRRASYSSYSSQFLENRTLFWGSVPWHYGIILILLAHLIAFLVPGPWGALLDGPVSHFVLEMISMGLALLSIVGLLALIERRLGSRRIRAVTDPLNWVVAVLLLVQVVLGFGVALFLRWGSGWYLFTAVPWLASLATFNPQVQTVIPLPWLAKLHFLNAFLLFAVFPFSRLVHIVTFPITYIWRPYQPMIWNRRTGTAEVRKA